MNFQPPFDRRKSDIQTAAPFGWCPDGYWIVFAEDLPTLPIPKRVVITREMIEFDGWVFPFSHVSKRLLVWMQQSFVRWTKEDASNQNKRWVEGIMEAFQDGLAGKL